MNLSPYFLCVLAGSAAVTAFSLIWSVKVSKKLKEDFEEKQMQQSERILKGKKKLLITRINAISDEEDYTECELHVDTFLEEQQIYMDEVECTQNIIDLELALESKRNFAPKK